MRFPAALVLVLVVAVSPAGCVRLGFDPPRQSPVDTQGERLDSLVDARSDGGADAAVDGQPVDGPVVDGPLVDGPALDLPPPGTGTWISGSTTANTGGSYGTRGVPAAGNAPSARYGAAIGADALGRVWLFGGNTGTASGAVLKSDLWRFDNGLWTWIAGPSKDFQPGVYGTLGVPGAGNRPGARQYPAMWVDSKSTIWIFGGWGRDAVENKTCWLNDLWRFDGTMWTWMAGSALCDQSGVYGTLGVPGSANTPGGRDGAGIAVDGQDRLWLVGGKGYDASSTSWGYLNDLWRFEGGAWVWLGGSNGINPGASYGTKGTADPSNHPGGRGWPCAWHAQGSLWVFGGAGFDSTDTYRPLNDLWRFDGTSWTWEAGSDKVDASGVYGTKGLPAPGNHPGARMAFGSAAGMGGGWIFGGAGYDAKGTVGVLNDLWLISP